MKNRITKNIKTVFDSTLDLYGRLDFLFNVIDDNGLSATTQDIQVGQDLTYDDRLVYTTPAAVNTGSTTTVKTLVARQGQDPFDLSLQLYGSIGGVFSLLESNENIENVNSTEIAGESVQYVEQSFTLPAHFRKNQIVIATGDHFYEDVLFRSFDSSFDLSFG